MHSSSYPKAVLLFTCKHNDGVYYFVNDSQALPGASLNEYDEVRIKDSSFKLISEITLKNKLVYPLDFNDNYLKIDLDRIESSPQSVKLYIVRGADLLENIALADTYTWTTMPDILRSMPANKSRLAYLKAFQLLQGAHLESLTAYNIKSIPTQDKGDH